MTIFTYPDVGNTYGVLGSHHDWINNGELTGFFVGYSKRVWGTMISQNHHRDRDGKYRSGGPWLMDKRETHFWGDLCTTYRNGEALAYKGIYRVDDEPMGSISGSFDSNLESHWSTVNSYGAQAYNALKPTRPDFSAANSLYELKDVPGMLRDSLRGLRMRMRRHPRYRLMNRAGRWHLALQLGWLPLLNDVISFERAFRGGNKRFQQLLRDEGRGVRRKRNLYKTGNEEADRTIEWATTHSTSYNPYLKPTHVLQCYGGTKATTQNSVYQFTKVWCAGKAHYWLPPGPRDMNWRRSIARKILGANVTPDVVYNAIPWTWLADYFSSLGHFVSAVSGDISDRIVFDYAYLMHHKEWSRRCVATQSICGSNNPYAGRVIRAFRDSRAVRKTRKNANPFGFGLKEEDLSSRQLGILGALGLSYLT